MNQQYPLLSNWNQFWLIRNRIVVSELLDKERIHVPEITIFRHVKQSMYSWLSGGCMGLCISSSGEIMKFDF